MRCFMQAQVRVASKYVGKSGDVLPDTLDTVCCVKLAVPANLEKRVEGLWASYRSQEDAIGASGCGTG